MTSGNCPGHPLGPFKGDHLLIDGACNYCLFGHQTGGPTDTPRSPGSGGGKGGGGKGGSGGGKKDPKKPPKK